MLLCCTVPGCSKRSKMPSMGVALRAVPGVAKHGFVWPMLLQGRSRTPSTAEPKDDFLLLMLCGFARLGCADGVCWTGESAAGVC